jgi:hypothetical protein
MNRLEILYYTIGLHYYITGRYSARAWLSPTAGNLFHHAVEMFLKGYLTRSQTEQQRRRLQHRLPDIWAEYKTQVADPTLDRFDATITALHDFEDIRYPECLLNEGAGILFDWSPRGGRSASSAMSGGGTHAVPEYRLYVADMDELIAALVRQASLNLAALTPSMHAEAKQFLVVDNSFIGGDPPNLIP